MRHIGGPLFDGLVFYGSAGLALVLGALMLRFPQIVLPVWLLWLWLVDGPHLIATYARTYFDPVVWQRQRALLLRSLLWLVPGPIIWLVARVLHAPTLFQGFLAFAALWAFHHALRQHYGFVAIYHQLSGDVATQRRRALFIDRWFLYFVLWGSFALYLCIHPLNRVIVGLPPMRSAVENILLWLLGGALVTVAGAYFVWLIVLAVKRRPLRPGLLVLSIAGTIAITLFGVGMAEPITPARQTPEQMFMASSVMGGILHGVPYLGIVLCANRRRFAAQGSYTLARLSRRPLALYAVLVVGAIVYMLLNSSRGVLPVGSLWPESSAAGQLFLSLFWGLFFHHYYVDARIWRLSRDTSLRTELFGDS